MRIEEIQIRKNHPLFQACEKACFYTRTLYNAANYECRQAFFRGESVFKLKLGTKYRTEDNLLFRRMPCSAAAGLTLDNLKKDWKNYFAAKRDYELHPEKYEKKPKLPGYSKGKKTFIVQRNGFSVKNHVLEISGFGSLKIRCVENQPFNQKKELSKLQEVRIIPMNGIFVIHLAYKENKKEDCRQAGLSSERILGLDLGIENFATMAAIGPDTEKLCPLIAKGGKLKSLNQAWNKECAELKSRKKSGHIASKSLKRYRKIQDFLHKLTYFIVEYCLEHGIGRICAGYNAGWKQEVNMGKKNNQAFVQLPHGRFLIILKYKAEALGIEFIEVEESYTSKASALDLDELPIFGKDAGPHSFSGRRIKRGLYRTKDGRLVNSDVNGLLNCIRKAFPKEFRDDLTRDPAVGGRLFRPKVLDFRTGSFRISGNPA